MKPTITELLPINQTLQKGGLPQQTVNARDLWQFLESKQHFADWIKNAIEAGLFKQGKDYFTFHKIMKRKTGERGASKLNEYAITLSMAKELAMLERNQQGKFARQYFIKCEERLAELAPDIVNTYRQAWRSEREASKTPYLKMCEALARSRQQQGKPCPQHLFTNEANMLASLVVGMPIQQWKQAHSIKSEVREAFNAEQLAKLTYLEQADEMLLDMGMADFQQRKAKLAEMLKNRFKD